MADDQRSFAPGPESLAPSQLRLTEAEFDMLIESGVAAKLGRLELRGGELYRMNAQHTPHMRMKTAIFRALDRSVVAAGPSLEVGVEGTIRYAGFMPIPDVFVYELTEPSGSMPGKDVRLVVEVADTTLSDDLGDKRTRYAKGSLPEYWVVDMQAHIILQHWAPNDGVYTQSATVAAGARIASTTLPGVAIQTKDLPWNLG